MNYQAYRDVLGHPDHPVFHRWCSVAINEPRRRNPKIGMWSDRIAAEFLLDCVKNGYVRADSADLAKVLY